MKGTLPSKDHRTPKLTAQITGTSGGMSHEAVKGIISDDDWVQAVQAH